jgi:uncharacterized repeat protein (TIGR03803 family)
MIRFSYALALLCGCLMAACSSQSFPAPASSPGPLGGTLAGGEDPVGGVVALRDGSIFGVTENGGFLSRGTVFEVNALGEARVVHNFVSADECGSPGAGLLLFGNMLYGTTEGGGKDNTSGAVFKVDPSTGSLHVVHLFTVTDGRMPEGLMTFRGKIYGMTQRGGSSDDGTIFEVNPQSGEFRVLHSFDGRDGRYPHDRLVALGEQLYGTTEKGGADEDGTVFKIDPTTGSETVVSSFDGRTAFGPTTGFTILKGTLYGTAQGSGGGVVFSSSGAVGSEIAVVGSGFRFPMARLVVLNGSFYTTSSSLFGSISELSPPSTSAEIVHNFSGLDGLFPSGELTVLDGSLYGVTRRGGADYSEASPVNLGSGTVFEFNPSTGAESVVYSFLSPN